MKSRSTELSVASPPGDGRTKSIVVLAILLVVVAQLLFSLLSRHVGEDSQAGSLAALGGVATSLLIVWLCQRLLGLGLGEIGLRRPASWPRTLGLGVLVALVANGVGLALMSYVLPLLVETQQPDVSRFDAVRGNLLGTITTILAVWVTSAFPEEVIWRGFLMTRLAKLAGGSRAAWGGALVLTSIHFGMVHFYQGAAGVLLTGVAGLFLGLAFLLFGRNLWIPIVAHAAMHVMSFTALYLGWL